MPKAGGFSDVETAKDYLRERAKGVHHWMGSCARSPRDLGGLVDSDLKVYGRNNLRVCDASISPIAARSNPRGVIYAVAEHAAQIIRSALARLYEDANLSVLQKLGLESSSPSYLRSLSEYSVNLSCGLFPEGCWTSY
ncbi:GMC oxidoreductase-domain-containing protein [Hypoxylon sp. FL0890]|nr:GMC oxidoreductase-domain-containing protein [Hypoxylon sp. FL0890]